MSKTKNVTEIKSKLNSSEADMVLIDIFKLLGDKNRYRIMKIISENEDRQLCVGDLASILDTSMSAVSQHLRILEMSGLIEGDRRGQSMCYKPLLTHPKIKEVIKLMK